MPERDPTDDDRRGRRIALQIEATFVLIVLVLLFVAGIDRLEFAGAF